MVNWSFVSYCAQNDDHLELYEQDWGVTLIKTSRQQISSIGELSFKSTFIVAGRGRRREIERIGRTEENTKTLQGEYRDTSAEP